MTYFTELLSNVTIPKFLFSDCPYRIRIFLFVCFYSLLHSLSPFRARYGFNFICTFFPQYQHIQNNAASFTWFSDDRVISDQESILIWLLIQQTTHIHGYILLPAFSTGGHLILKLFTLHVKSWLFQMCSYNKNQGDLMHFLELKSSIF